MGAALTETGSLTSLGTVGSRGDRGSKPGLAAKEKGDVFMHMSCSSREVSER